MVTEGWAKKVTREEAEGRKGRKEGNANRQSGLGNRLGAERKGESWATMSSSSNIRVGVGKGRSQVLDADSLKAMKAKRQRGMAFNLEPELKNRDLDSDDCA